MLRRVALVRPNVLEEPSGYTILRNVDSYKSHTA
jgi:hypothetical protein